MAPKYPTGHLPRCGREATIVNAGATTAGIVDRSQKAKMGFACVVRS